MYINGCLKDHIFDLRKKISAVFSIYGHIANFQSDHLPVGSIVLLVEHCTGIAEVICPNSVQAYFFLFLRLLLHNCLSYVYNCDNQSCFINKYIWKTIVLSKDDVMHRIDDILYPLDYVYCSYRYQIEESKSE